METVILAIVSYNKIPPYKKGIQVINGQQVLILPETFNPKSPYNVLESDANWQELILHKNNLRKIIIFAGKKDSGALAIIDLAVRSFLDVKERLFFILCDHDLKAKKKQFLVNGLIESQYIIFSDSHERCYETPFLLGFMHDYLLNK